MQNQQGELVDLYIPRKCSATNRLITAKDHGAVQFNVGHVDEHGFYTGEFTPIALTGRLRNMGLADDAVNKLMTDKGFLKHTFQP